MWANRISSIADTASVHLSHLSATTGKDDTMNTLFDNREDAGDQLAEALHSDFDIDIVVALPGGGLPVGRAVADRFDADLHCLVVQQIQAPFNPELAIGAVTGSGAHWTDNERIAALAIDERYVNDGITSEQEHAAERQELYGSTLPELDRKTVALVDDGIDTPAEIRAALTYLQEQDASVIVAAPVIPEPFRDQLADQATIMSLKTPETFVSTAHHYAEFKPLPDDEAATYLHDTERSQ